MNELIIEKNEKYNFLTISCEQGHYITNWDKQDIKEFTSAKKIFCPANTDTSQYYCVTEEEYNELMELQEKAMREEEEKRNQENIVVE